MAAIVKRDKSKMEGTIYIYRKDDMKLLAVGRRLDYPAVCGADNRCLGSISVTTKVDCFGDPSKMFLELLRLFNRKEKRKRRLMFHSVTHGCIIEVPIEGKEHDYTLVLDSPRKVRELLNQTKVIPLHFIVNKNSKKRHKVHGKPLILWNNNITDKLFGIGNCTDYYI